MKYVVAGASGHTGKPIAKKLLEAGHEVVVIGRSEKNLADLVALGATAAIGELDDEKFTTKAFAGAEAAYIMLPPKDDLTEPWRVYQRRLITSMANALQTNEVKYAVALSSMGSQLISGAGPISGLGELENTLMRVDGLNVYVIRPGYFMDNFYSWMYTIKNYGAVMGSISPEIRVPLTHTQDVSAAAAAKLLALDFTGFEKGFVAGAADYSFPECVAMVAAALGKPELKYVEISLEQFKQGLISSGMNPYLIDGYIQMNTSLGAGKYLDDFVRTPENTSPTGFDKFVGEFAYVYNMNN